MLAGCLAGMVMLMPKEVQDRAVWLATSLERFYPSSPARKTAPMDLDAARGGRVSFQVVTRSGAPGKIKIEVAKAAGVTIQVRRVCYVPMKHLNTDTPAAEADGAGNVPGLVPDPLLPESEYLAPANTTNAFWVTLRVLKSAKPGRETIPVLVRFGDDVAKVSVVAELTIHNAVLTERKDFPVTHWFYCDALSDYYKLKPFEEKFWPILERYIRDLVEHGNDVMHTPVFTPPTDGVKKPTQLLQVTKKGDKYVFDWTDVRRFIKLAKKCGIRYYEWAHFFTQWGCRNAIRIYEGDPTDEKLLWPADTAATSPIYRQFLGQLIPELEKFLNEEGIRNTSFFHISDEPDGEEALANYRAARKMMRDLAPWMKFMDALSHIDFAKEGLVDMPIPILNTAPEFTKAGYPAWCYFCGGPRGEYLQRLMDTPLPKIGMAGWLFYKLQSKGFLHWGYNYWYKSQTCEMIDPYEEQSGDAWPGWAYGDPFVVYPGKDGPIDSIRWEIFAESLQDYALLQAAKISPDDPMLAEIKDYAKFPKSAEWLLRARKQVLTKFDGLP